MRSGYVAVSDEIVLSRLADLGDLDEFVGQVTIFLGQPTADEVFDRVEEHRGGSVSFNDAVDETRKRRDPPSR